MEDDLQELRAGAKQIVERDNGAFYNYVFVEFEDPCEYVSLFN